MFFFMILELGVGENWVPPESSRSSSAISIFSKGVFGAPNFRVHQIRPCFVPDLMVVINQMALSHHPFKLNFQI